MPRRALDAMGFVAPAVDGISARRAIATPGESATSLQVVTAEADFFALKQDWEALLENCEHPSPSLSWNWLRAWWEHLGRTCPRTGDTSDLHVIVVRNAEGVIGIIPLFSRRHGLLSIKPRRLHPIGYGGKLDMSSLTEEAIVLIRRGFGPSVIEAACDHLNQELARGKWDVFIIRFLESAETSHTTPNLLRGRMRVKRRPSSLIVSLPSTWDAFRKRLTKSMRDNLAYYPNLLARHGHRWSVKIIDRPEEITSAVEDLIRLHILRASTGIGRYSYFTYERQKRFYTEVHEAMARAGEGFVAQLEIDGVVVAAQSFLANKQQWIAGYSGFDPAWKAYSPLFVLESAVFKLAHEAGVREINLLGGDAHWQMRWKPKTPCILTTVAAIRPTPLSLFRVGVHAFRREIILIARRNGVVHWLDRMKAKFQRRLPF